MISWAHVVGNKFFECIGCNSKKNLFRKFPLRISVVLLKILIKRYNFVEELFFLEVCVHPIIYIDIYFEKDKIKYSLSLGFSLTAKTRRVITSLLRILSKRNSIIDLALRLTIIC